MIFYNGGSNPSAIAYNGTSLENVYFNGTLVWTQNKSETSGSGSGTIPIYDSSGNIDGYTVDVPDASYEGQTGSSLAPDSISGTVKCHFSSSRYAYFNDLTKLANVMYCDSNMAVVGHGAEYRGTLSVELEFNPSDYTPVSGDGKFYVFDSGLHYGSEYVSWSGLPSGMTIAPSIFNPVETVDDVTVTCTAVLSGGGTATRVYSGTFIFDDDIIYIYGDAYGDESEIAAATSGYVMQEEVSLYLIYE